MYLISSRIKIKKEWFFSTFNHKILNLTIPVVCRKNLNQSDHTDCKIITIDGNKRVSFVKSPDCCQCFEIQ
jgi:hypothetical protein